MTDASCGFSSRPVTEHISYEELTKAYFDCRRHKRNTRSALAYEQDYEVNNLHLWRELNDGTYTVGQSVCFCVTRPKIREVFAASFRDRIVHHLLINRILPIVENHLVGDTYSCRKGKGVFYGVRRIGEQVKAIGKECWFAKVDLSGFFMSIDRDILYRKIEDILLKEWKDGDLEWWLSLLRQVVFNRPERNCLIKGDIGLWNMLPPHKSLFKTNGKGLPIGNITSQILANLYLSDIDHRLIGEVAGYGRYVDDIILLDPDREKIKGLLPGLRERCAELGLSFNEGKTVIQRADKGILFTGYIIKPWGVYSGKRIIEGAVRASEDMERTDRHLNRLNSYLGFLRQTLSFGVRYRIWNATQGMYHGLYATNHLNSIHQTIKQ